MTLHRRLSLEPKGPVTSDTLSRAWGQPPGIAPGRWPTFYDEGRGEDIFGTHLLTVDVKALEIYLPEAVVALSLFMSDPEMPLYFDDPTADLAVVQLTAEDLKHPVPAQGAPAKPLRQAQGLRFDAVTGNPGRDYTGSFPRYLQEAWTEQDDPHFVLQCGEGLLGVNLGDSGQLYMFTKWAMWDCR